MGNEHDDDLPSTVDTRDDETDDYPKTSHDFGRQDQEKQEKDATERDEESIVGK